MRRFVAIVIVTALVLALSAGTAFASACAVAPCAAMQAITTMTDHGCSPAAVQDSCASPMQSPASMQARCDMKPETRTGDASSAPRTAPELTSAVVVDVLVPAALIGSSAAPAPVPVDARAAPHLSAVIRI
ncbi:MAG: hypothetical protein Q7W30_08810 [Coriobacteriia bacterium]|nr:hypothetical protein [Coriobacteriia bacterium]